LREAEFLYRPPMDGEKLRYGASPVSIAAIADSDDFDGVVALLAVYKAPRADTKTEQGRIEAFKLFDIASIGLQKAAEGIQKLQGRIAVYRAEVGAGLGGPDDSLSHRAS
jgi:hypothetical protein